MDQKETILLVDDEQDILDFLSYNLKKEGYKIFTALNGVDGIKLAKKIEPTLIIMDVMMPLMDGIEACQLIRDNQKIRNQPIIVFLTSRNEDYSQIAGYEAGADDYISKPIRPRLLISKVKSILRRLTSTENINNVNIKIDRNKFIVKVKDETLSLPKKEFHLLELLISEPGKVFTRDQIMNIVWGNETIVGDRTIDVHIRKLREKIGDNYIRTIKGVGYTYNET